MRKIILFAALLTCMSVYANPVCTNQFSTMSCGKGTVSNINFLGYVELDGTYVTNHLTVLGGLNADNANLKNVSIRGDAQFKKTFVLSSLSLTGNVKANELNIQSASDITGDFTADHVVLEDVSHMIGAIDCKSCIFKLNANITGSVTAIDSEFLQTLTLSSIKATFIHSKCNDIIFKKTTEDKEEKLYLNNESTAHNIVFENAKGIVYLDSHSHITGYVQGGKIVKL